MQQLNVDNVKNPLSSLRRLLLAFAIIGCSLTSVGVVAAQAQYYRHHHHHYYRHHRHTYWRHHHRYYRNY
jgi:hypothetical protein